MTHLRRALVSLALAFAAAGAPAGCSGGVVGGECRQGFGVCEGRCFDFRIDPENCGACGKSCPAAETCADGVCSVGLDAGADASSNATGGADNGASGGASGFGGSGGTSGNAGVTGSSGKAGSGGTAGAGGTAIVDGGDASAGRGGVANSGGAGGAGGRLGTGGTGGAADASAGGVDGGIDCIPPYETAAHCGNCFVTCVAPKPICSPGNDGHICVSLCTAPLVQCGTACVNTDTDEDNCGKCGNLCASGICQGGKCVGATAGHEALFCMDYRTQPATGSPQERLLGNAVFLSPANPVRVLGYAQYAPAAVVTAVNATLKSAATARGRTAPAVTAAATSLDVTNKLSVVNFDVLLIYDQSTAPAGRLATIGSDWAGTIDPFVRAGGTVIVLAGDGGTGDMPALLSNAGLLDTTGQTTSTGVEVYNRALGDALGINVLTSFRGPRETCTFITSGPDALSTFVITDTPATAGMLGEPVVVHRVVSP